MGSQASRIVPLRADALPDAFARPGCGRCGVETGYLVRYVNSDNRSSLRWCCDNCAFVYTTLDLPYELLGARPNLNELPVIRREFEPDTQAPCVICDQPGVHWHHWAPRAVFPDWPDAASVSLCLEHHEEWHRRMRDHGFRFPHEFLKEME